MVLEQLTRNKKLFIGITIALAACIILVFLASKSENTSESQVNSSNTAPPRVYTEAEKMDILKNIAAQTPKDTTPQSQDLKTLNNLSKQTPKDTATTEDKLKILQALSTQTN